MTDVLDIIGLLALVVAGFLITMWLGFAVGGAGCLWVSWSVTARRRRVVEIETARRRSRMAA